MKKKQKLLVTVIILLIISIIYTLLIKYVDVKEVGKENVEVGFSTINKLFYDTVGVSDLWYKISKYLGLIPFLICAYYGFIGIKQFIKEKSLKKVDKKLIYLGVFYIIVLILYVVADKIVINYRPVLEDGVLESSYPSSHTLLAVCVCASSLLISKYYVSKKYLKYFDNISFVLMIFLTVTRALSGYHWFTDIIGGIIISIFLVSAYKYSIYQEKTI